MPLSRDAFIAKLISLAHAALCAAHEASWPADPHLALATDGRYRVYLSIAPPLTGPWDCPTCRLLGGADAQRTTFSAQRPTGERRPATVNERMLAQLEADPERIGWSARKWADALGCSPSTVTLTPAWRRLMTARALNRAQRTESRSD